MRFGRRPKASTANKYFPHYPTLFPLFTTLGRVCVPRGVRSLATVVDELRALLRASEQRAQASKALADSEAEKRRALEKDRSLTAMQSLEKGISLAAMRAASEKARHMAEKDLFLSNMRLMSGGAVDIAQDNRRKSAPSSQVVGVARLLQGFPKDDGASWLMAAFSGHSP